MPVLAHQRENCVDGALDVTATGVWFDGRVQNLERFAELFRQLFGNRAARIGVQEPVAAFQRAGSDLGTAVLQQGLLQDPIDKTMEFFIVYAILQVVSRRITARFPQGERALGVVPADGEEELR